jgi:hypothetical protein
VIVIGLAAVLGNLWRFPSCFLVCVPSVKSGQISPEKFNLTYRSMELVAAARGSGVDSASELDIMFP